MDGIPVQIEAVIPFGSLPGTLMSPDTDKEIPIARQQHTIDLVFDLHKDDAAAPVSGTWTVLRPRKAGFITSVQAWEVGVGTNANNNTVDVTKNGSTVLTATIPFNNGDTNNSMKSGTLSTSPMPFAADDRIAIVVVKHGSNDGVGLKVRIKGYYVSA
ncbi:MAG: hypothetical protein AB7I57_18295 [Pirellulales bacterium]